MAISTKIFAAMVLASIAATAPAFAQSTSAAQKPERLTSEQWAGASQGARSASLADNSTPSSGKVYKDAMRMDAERAGSESGILKPPSSETVSAAPNSGAITSDTLRTDAERAGSESGILKPSMGAMEPAPTHSGTITSDTLRTDAERAGSESGILKPTS